MAPTRIPLFPLEVVLFPGVKLPLHIFEPRYKDMVRDCREQNLNFGVVLAQGEELSEIGCTAEIVEIAKTFPSGEMDIITVGHRVFQVMEVIEERSYYEAQVDYLEDEPVSPHGPSTALLQLFERCHQAAYGHHSDRGELEKAASAAFHIASELPLELSYKQKLLEIRNEEERRRSLELSLARWLQEIEQSNRARQIAGGNGHPRYN
jgi:Lon protease-like protein